MWGDVAGCIAMVLSLGKDMFTKRLSALILDGSKSGSFKITVENEATIGAFGV